MRRFLANWQGEVDSAAQYRAMAASEAGTESAKKIIAFLKENFPKDFGKIRFPETSGIGIKPGKAEPIDGSFGGDERGGAGVAYEPVVTDRRRHYMARRRMPSAHP